MGSCVLGIEKMASNSKKTKQQRKNRDDKLSKKRSRDDLKKLQKEREKEGVIVID